MSDLFDPVQQAKAAGASLIDEPIINRPYVEPPRHWKIVDLDTGVQQAPHIVEGRRDAGYFIRRQGVKSGGPMMAEQFVPLSHVNEIRSRVRQWRESGYPNVTPITRKLLEHWNLGRPERDHPIFFCQKEAVETVIWLHEAHPADRQGLTVDVSYMAGLGGTDAESARVPLSEAHDPFTRYCTKMATGTGKTIVMSMVIAWSVLNKLHSPKATWCSDAVLIVAPGVTVKERLRVVLPSEPGNYYDNFDLVPVSLRAMLGQARICLVHRQEMAIRDDSKTRSVTKLGRESDTSFANRLLKRELGSRGRILVLNDEGHHCYRPVDKVRDVPAQLTIDGEIEVPILKKSGKAKSADDEAPNSEAVKENENAAQWITGLEKIHAARGILTCLDLSATPFYIKGSGYPEGRPFPWIVSDFGLVDAIESGLVKIPQMPVDDNHGDGKRPPAYFHLWDWINEGLAPEDKETLRRKAKPEKVVAAAEPALVTMIGNWKKEFERWKKEGSPVPPALIVVTGDTDLSRVFYERLTAESFEFREFVNEGGKPPVTFLYDSKELEKAEAGEKAKDAIARKRAIMNTVGKEGKPGQDVRCIVSVSMLTEGWDANNVTQIVGVRGFTSQLLCEQVVGRALRRRSYDVDPETGLLQPEYADVYGVPFQVIPVKAKGGGPVKQPPVTTLVQALADRAKDHEILFPRVEGYVTAIQHRVVCDWEKVPRLVVGKSGEPTVVHTKAAVGLRVGRPDRSGPGALQTTDRMPYYLISRVQTATFRIAAELVKLRVATTEGDPTALRARLFPQFLEIVRRYVDECVVFDAAPSEEIGLQRWQDKIINALNEHIHEGGEDGEPVIIPRIERFRPEGSTRETFFRTSRTCRETIKSHVSHVVLDSTTWENTAAYVLETSRCVRTYTRNDHVDFTIPYVDLLGTPRAHRPDFLVVLSNGLHVALEVKGHERELDDVKKRAGLKWAAAVNRYYGEQRWVYAVCYDPKRLARQLAALAGGAEPIVMPEITDELFAADTEPVLEGEFEWISASQLGNLGREPLLDFLRLYGKDLGYIPDHERPDFDPRLEMGGFLREKGKLFEHHVLRLIREKVPVEEIESDGFELTQEGLASTFDAMRRGVKVIYQGFVADEQSATWGRPDLLVRSDVLGKIWAEVPVGPAEASETATTLGTEPWHYVVVDIKYKSFKLLAGGEPPTSDLPKMLQVAIYNRALGVMQGYEPRLAYMLGRQVVPHKSLALSGGCFDRLAPVTAANYTAQADNAADWVRLVRAEGAGWVLEPKPTLTKLWPNMSNSEDAPWHQAKREIAGRMKPLSALWQVTPSNQGNALQNGISTWDSPDLSATIFGLSPNRTSTLQAILDAQRLPEGQVVLPAVVETERAIWGDSDKLEFYVDFETVSDLDDDFSALPKKGGSPCIFMVGCGHVENGEWKFSCFMADSLSPESERDVLQGWIQHMSAVTERLAPGTEPLVFHWSPAEVSTFESAFNSAVTRLGGEWPTVGWFDFLNRVVKSQPVTVKGALGFGLKAIAKAMYAQGLIETKWEDGPLDGLAAMVGAWRANQEARLSGRTLREVELMRDIESYNEVDCRVTWEIVRHLRLRH